MRRVGLGALLAAAAVGGLLAGCVIGWLMTAGHCERLLLFKDAEQLWLLERIRLLDTKGPSAEDIKWMNVILQSKEEGLAFQLKKNGSGNEAALKLLTAARTFREQRATGSPGS